MSNTHRLSLAAAVVACVVLGSACDSDDEGAATSPPAVDAGAADAGGDASDGGAATDAAGQTDASTALTQAEADFLTFNREEEKLARDVYLKLQGVYPAFTNIAASEQTHMDAVLVLLERYGLPDPAAGKAQGEFSNASLQAFYDELVARGSQSTIAAIEVGLTIEERDIRDLSAFVDQTSRQDIRLVVENLLRGSRNHLRAFYQALVNLGGTYTPQYLDPATFDSIAKSPMETGGPPGF